MELITIGQARTQCRLAEGEDDAILSINAAAAERACMRAANRNLYVDQTALDAAIAALPAAMAIVYADYDDAIEAAALLEDSREKADAEQAAKKALYLAKLNQTMTINGIVATEEIIGAILLTVDYFYVNQGEATLALPGAAQNLINMIRYVGE